MATQTPQDLLSLPTSAQIVESEINTLQAQTTRLSDFNVGSIIRTILESVAMAIRGCYDVLAKIFEHAYIATAKGFALDLKVGDIGVARKQATAAQVTLTFSRATVAPSNLLIPRGTRVTTEATTTSPAVPFETTQDAILPVGALSVDVPAVCVANLDAGESFPSQEVFVTAADDAKNVVAFALPLGCAGRIYRSTQGGAEVLLSELAPGATYYIDAGQRTPGSQTPPVVGYDRLPFPTGVSVSTAAGGSLPGATYYYRITSAWPDGVRGNVAAHTIVGFSNQPQGVEAVDNAAEAAGGTAVETDDQLRVRAPLYLANLARATKNALRYGALSVNGVYNASVVENFPADGTCTVYVDDGTGGCPDSLIQAVGAEIENWRAAGIAVVIEAPDPVDIDVTATLTLEALADPTFVNAAAAAAVQEWLMGHEVGADVILSKLVALVADLDGVEDVTFSEPTGNTTIAAGEVARPGTITFTEA